MIFEISSSPTSAYGKKRAGEEIVGMSHSVNCQVRRSFWRPIIGHHKLGSFFVWVVFISGLSCNDHPHTDSLADRERVSDAIDELRASILKDPQNERNWTELRAHLNSNWSFARTSAAVAVGKLGPLAKRLIPDLLNGLNSTDSFVERECARALGTVAVDDPIAVVPLMAKLRDEESDVAWFAADSLGMIGKPALTAVPDLEKASHSQNRLMASAAKRALKRLELVSISDSNK